MKKIKRQLSAVLLISLAVLFVTNRFDHLLPEMPLTIPAFMGTAISVLLSFKLSQSYDRWWEARKIWGSIVNDSRTLVIQLNSFVKSGNEEAIKVIGYRQIAWCYSFSRALRGQDPLHEMDHLLGDEEMRELRLHKNPSLAMLQMHARDLKKLREADQLTMFSHVQIDETLVRLCDSQGRAERIKLTVFPVTYRLFLHYIIYVFLITLSVSLMGVAWYFEIPLLLIIASAFFLLEKSATHMQDPFENRPTDISVTTISRNIEINLRQLMGESTVPEPYPASGFYAL